MFRLVTATMSNAVRSVTVERGRDPRTFTFCSYGGALGVFAASICREIGIRHVVVPVDAAVFSANGLLAADDVRQLSRSIMWSGAETGSILEALRSLEEEAVQQLEASGYTRDVIEVEWQGDFKFEGQLFELTVPIPRDEDLDTALGSVRATFNDRFEAEFGPGTAWVGSPVILLGVRVVATGRAAKFQRAPVTAPVESARAQNVRTREVVLPPNGELCEVSIYDGETLVPGTTFGGPAVVDDRLTTLLVPVGWTLSVDAYGHKHLYDEQPSSARLVAGMRDKAITVVA
jgi:N-methylhydantoinase A